MVKKEVFEWIINKQKNTELLVNSELSVVSEDNRKSKKKNLAL